MGQPARVHGTEVANISHLQIRELYRLADEAYNALRQVSATNPEREKYLEATVAYVALGRQLDDLNSRHRFRERKARHLAKDVDRSSSCVPNDLDNVLAQYALGVGVLEGIYERVSPEKMEQNTTIIPEEGSFVQIRSDREAGVGYQTMRTTAETLGFYGNVGPVLAAIETHRPASD